MLNFKNIIRAFGKKWKCCFNINFRLFTYLSSHSAFIINDAFIEKQTLRIKSFWQVNYFVIPKKLSYIRVVVSWNLTSTHCFNNPSLFIPLKQLLHYNIKIGKMLQREMPINLLNQIEVQLQKIPVVCGFRTLTKKMC